MVRGQSRGQVRGRAGGRTSAKVESIADSDSPAQPVAVQPAGLGRFFKPKEDQPSPLSVATTSVGGSPTTPLTTMSPSTASGVGSQQVAAMSQLDSEPHGRQPETPLSAVPRGSAPAPDMDEVAAWQASQHDQHEKDLDRLLNDVQDDDCEKKVPSLAVALEHVAATRQVGEGGDFAKMQAELAKLEEEIKHGVGTRSSLGVAFARHPKGGLSQGYKECTTNTERLAFRNHWAEDRLQVLKETRFKLVTDTKAEIEKGSYFPFDIIVDKEGGPNRPNAVKAAILYCQACIKMSAHWTMFNSMTQRLEYLYMKKSFINTFQTAWRVHQEMTDVKGKTDVSVIGAGGSGGGGADTTGEIKLTGAQKRKLVKHNGEAGNDGDASEKKAKKPLDSALADARKVKTEYDTVHSNYHTLMSMATTAAEWTTWCSESTLKLVQDAFGALQRARSNFAGDFWVMEPKDLKSKYSASDLEREAKVMAHELRLLIQILEMEVRSLQGMHKARLAARCSSSKK
jgi:hypothetical protein